MEPMVRRSGDGGDRRGRWEVLVVGNPRFLVSYIPVISHQPSPSIARIHRNTTATSNSAVRPA